MLVPFLEKDRLEAGCDEAGRGCLAGPVTAAAVMLSPDFALDLVQDGILNDSKKLAKTVRKELRQKIESQSISWAVVHVSNEEIDRINILQAALAGMRRAVRKLDKRPEFLLIDGNRFNPSNDMPPHACFVQGDGKYAAIAAASILAKTHRDELMDELHMAHPQYGWESNAGYPTAAHRTAIRHYGLTLHHRRSFRQLPEQLTIFK